MRAQYAAQLGQIVPSGRVNGPYRQQIEVYKQKMGQAAGVDQQIVQRHEQCKAMFSMLSKSRGELAAMIPASASGQDISSNPVVMTIKNALTQLDEISLKKDEVMSEGLAMHENFNAVEELMKVIQNHAQKAEVFESYKKKYMEHFAKNDELETQRQNISQVIAQNGQPLNGLIQSNKQDPAKAQFFTQLNDAINAQEQLSNMFVQSNQFYTQLNDQLIKLQQQVGDYKMSRDMQRNEAVKGASGGAPQMQQMQAPPGMMMPGMMQMPPMQQPPQGQQPQAYGQMPLGASFNYGQPGGQPMMPPPGGFQNPYGQQ